MVTPEQITQYHAEGYTLVPEMLSRPEVDSLLAEVEALTAMATVANHDATRQPLGFPGPKNL